MFVVHFEKADLEFTGSYQMINQLFVQNEVLPAYPFVNREGGHGHRRVKEGKAQLRAVQAFKKIHRQFLALPGSRFVLMRKSFSPSSPDRFQVNFSKSK